MADSPVDICNSALAFLGDYTISSLDENNKQSRACALWYPKARKMVLEEHNWNCAKHVKTIPKDGGEPPMDWAYSYAMPSDCIRLIRFKDPDARFEVRGRQICADTADGTLLYIRDVEDTTYFPPLLSDCIALMLAQKIAFSLTGEPGIVSQITTLFERQMAKARGSDAQLDAFADFIPSDWHNARF